MSRQICLTAVLPVRTPIEREFIDIIDSTIDELVSLSGIIQFDFLEFGSIRPSLQWHDPDDSHELIQESRRQTHHFTRLFLIAKAELTIPATPVPVVSSSGDSRVANAEEANWYYHTVANRYFTKRLNELIVACNIAHPGSVEVHKGLLFSNDSLVDNIPATSAISLRKAWAKSIELDWPVLKRLSLIDVWIWLSQNNGFRSGFGGGRTGRALNALTRIMEPHVGYEPVELVWALVALESLYTRGQTSMLEQVKDRSQLFLGQQQAFKKVISRMYQFRSRFVHGDLDFPGAVLVNDEPDESGNYLDELVESISVAEAILLGSFQRLVEYGWPGIEFDLAVRSQ